VIGIVRVNSKYQLTDSIPSLAQNSTEELCVSGAPSRLALSACLEVVTPTIFRIRLARPY